MNKMKHIHFPPPVADEMIRAIQADRKTVTRRVVKPPVMNTIVTPPLQPANSPGMWAFYGEDRRRRAPYWPGDILYVRETFQVDYLSNIPGTGRIHYKADDTYADFSFSPNRYEMMRRAQIKPGWRPNENMPREAARLFLRVTDVRVERLQDITEEQAQKEGCKGWKVATSRDWDINPDYLAEFRYIWNNTINKADLARYGWDSNPWVWVIEFERIRREEAIPHV